MPIDGHTIKELIERELSTVSDHRVVSHIRRMLIEPYMILRIWDYGEEGQQLPCWMVLNDVGGSGEIAYCEFGFGPRCPWGLLSSGETPEDQHMGMDSGWFTSFLDAFFCSLASTELPIWRVFNGEVPWPGTPLTDEGTWEDAWKEVEELKETNPKGRYCAHHSITYAKSGDALQLSLDP
jgi:hypothetical protein